MKKSGLERRLARCLDDGARHADFSIAHRGAPLHLPDHTREAYIAAGAWAPECELQGPRVKNEPLR